MDVNSTFEKIRNKTVKVLQEIIQLAKKNCVEKSNSFWFKSAR